MRRRIRVMLTIVGLSIAIFLGISWAIGSQVFLASTQLVSNQETAGVPHDFLEKHGLNYETFLELYTVEKVDIPSSYEGHMIPADYIYTPESNNSRDHQTVILVHGLGDNRYSNYPIAEYFLERGFNVISYDQRSTNENTAPYTTFGYREKYDVIDWVDYVEKQASGRVIGVWGASYGGATAGLALAHENIDERVDFLILDCPVSSMEWMIEQEMRGMGISLPVGYLTWCGNIVTKTELGFTYQDTDVANAMRVVRTPVLIVNSKEDAMTPYFMGKDIHDAIGGDNSTIWTVEDSEHCEIWLDHNLEYRATVDHFLATSQGVNSDDR